MLNANEVKLLTNDPDNKRRHRFQVATIHAHSDGSRRELDFIANVTNERIVGITLVAVGEDANKSLSRSTISLNIDNQEILPKNFNCSLIMNKEQHSFYDSILQIDEPADGKQITLTYTDNTNMDEYDEEFDYDVNMYFWSIAKDAKDENSND